MTTESVGASAEVLEMTDLSGKYLTFLLAKESYGLQILAVQEIIGLMEIVDVPRTPDFVRGVINLRGRIIPVVELRSKFEMETMEDTEKTCIIVVQIEDAGGGVVTTGLLVDEVSEVLDITDEMVEPTPQFGSSVDTGFILGVAKAAETVVMLLDVNMVLTADELTSISAT
jgi:purine-binding chemotaxis protein CheW